MFKAKDGWKAWPLILTAFLFACNVAESSPTPSAADPTAVPPVAPTVVATLTVVPTLAPTVSPTLSLAAAPPQGDAPYSLDNCEAATGVTFFGDHGIDNRTLCYQARAAERNDWNSCLQLPSDPPHTMARCLVDVGQRTALYLCAKPSFPAVVNTCNQLLMSEFGSDPALHQLAGIEAYRVERQIELQAGDDFNVPGQPPTLSADGLVSLADYYPASTHICHPQETPPLVVGTGIIGANLYIAGCTTNGDSITISYFKYELAGISYPAHL